MYKNGTKVTVHINNLKSCLNNLIEMKQIETRGRLSKVIVEKSKVLSYLVQNFVQYCRFVNRRVIECFRSLSTIFCAILQISKNVITVSHLRMGECCNCILN